MAWNLLNHLIDLGEQRGRDDDRRVHPGVRLCTSCSFFTGGAKFPLKCRDCCPRSAVKCGRLAASRVAFFMGVQN
jgi:hypothetical protein